jgi:hypothetical protein
MTCQQKRAFTLLLPCTDYRSFWKNNAKGFARMDLLIGNTQRQILFRKLLPRSSVPLVHQVQTPPETHRQAQHSSYRPLSLQNLPHRISNVPGATCDCGEPTESPNHVLWQCSGSKSGREDKFRDQIKWKVYPPCKIRCLFSGDRSTDCSLSYLPSAPQIRYSQILSTFH